MFLALLLTMAVSIDDPPVVVPIAIVPAPPLPPAPPLSSRTSGPAPARPRMQAHMLFSTDDYPLAAISKSEEGNVRVDLTITSAGRVGDCRIAETSNSPALDVTTCNILRRRARYTPARDHLGRPVEDRQTLRIRWRLEGTAGGAPFTSWIYRTIVRLDAQHQPIGCRYEYGSQGADLANCQPHFMAAREVLTGSPNLSSGKPASLVFEHRFEAGPTTSAPAAAIVPGKLVIATDVAEFEVDPDGNLLNCRSVVRQGRPKRDLCATPFSRRFNKDPATLRTARMSATVYAMIAP